MGTWVQRHHLAGSLWNEWVLMQQRWGGVLAVQEGTVGRKTKVWEVAGGRPGAKLKPRELCLASMWGTQENV